MAVPTITSVTPSEGLTRGRNIVAIAGTNFRLPPAPPADGPVGGDQQKTVDVKFAGVASEWAYAATAELIYARVPEWRGDYNLTFPIDLDVRVANLDDDGNEIAGENVTLADGYAVNQPGYAEESYFQQVVREILRLFRRHVFKNTHITVARDYDDDPSDLKRMLANTPVVHLVGPTTPLNRFYSINREDVEEDPSDPDAYFRLAPPVTVDIEFDIRGYAKTSRQLYAIQQAVLMMFRDITFVRVDIDPNDPAQGYKEYEFHLPFESYPRSVTIPNFSDLVSFFASCVIRGVHIDDEAGTIIERGWRITANDGEPVVDLQSS
jgi:hypothetical protein